MTELLTLSLNKILRENGVKNFKSIIDGAMSTSYNRYMEYVEPEYAISRIIPYVNDKTNHEKIVKANKSWMTLLVQNEWSEHLKPYIDRYGQVMVSYAIDYAIDNNMWQSPEGDTALKKKKPDQYDGLKIIDEGVEFFKLNNGFSPDSKPTAENSAASQNEENNTAIKLANTIRDTMLQVGNDMELLCKYVKNHADPTEQEKTNEMLAKMIDADKKQIDDLTEKLEEEKEKSSKFKEERDKVQSSYTTKSKQYTEIRTKYDALSESYNKLNEEHKKLENAHELLKNAAQKEMPTKRLIPMSKLRVPYVGPAAITLLRPVLEKYGILIDDNK